MYNRTRLRLQREGRAAEFHEKWDAVCRATKAQRLRIDALEDADPMDPTPVSVPDRCGCTQAVDVTSTASLQVG